MILGKYNLPGYFIYQYFRIQIAYATAYDEWSRPTHHMFIDSNICVNIQDYEKMINKYECKVAWFTEYNMYHTIWNYFYENKINREQEELIQKYTYFSYDFKTWYIDKLVKHFKISRLDIVNIFGIKTLIWNIEVKTLDKEKCGKFLLLLDKITK